MKTYNLKGMSRSVNNAYANYLDNSAHANKINISKVKLPNDIKQTFFNLVKKYKGVFYGTVVTVSYIPSSRKTLDLDCYLPRDNIHKMLYELERKYGSNIRYRKGHFDIVKVEYKTRSGWIEVADVGQLEKLQKDKSGKYVLTTSPIRATTSNKPIRDYGGVKGQSLECQHQRKINGTQFSSNNEVAQKRFPKDSYDVGVLNRYTVTQLIRQYKKTHNKKLKKDITVLLQEIINFSTDSKVQRVRYEFENACLKNGLCTTRLFDGKHNALLNSIKRKLANGTFDLDKDLMLVESAVKPTSENQEMTAYRTEPKKKKRTVSQKVLDSMIGGTLVGKAIGKTRHIRAGLKSGANVRKNSTKSMSRAVSVSKSNKSSSKKSGLKLKDKFKVDFSWF